ncbi:hypothetical protein Hanom_Chr03g00270921 [Helianthus anomalus]
MRERKKERKRSCVLCVYDPRFFSFLLYCIVYEVNVSAFFFFCFKYYYYLFIIIIFYLII